MTIDIAPGSGPHLRSAALFAGGERASLTLWVDHSHRTEADIVRGLLTKVMMESVFSQVGNPAELNKMFGDLLRDMGPTQRQRPELAAFLKQGAMFAAEDVSRTAAKPAEPGGMALKPPLEIRVEPLAAGPRAGFNGFAHTFAGMLMQFLLFWASTHAKTLFGERSAGTLDRLRMTQATRPQILLGVAAAVGVVALVASLAVFGVGMLFFHIELRSGVAAFALVLLGQAALVGSFSLLLAGLANSDKQLESLETMVILLDEATSWQP